MYTIKLFNKRVDIQQSPVTGTVEYHCYLYRDNYLYHYRFKDNWWDALKFLIGYDTK